MMEIRGYVFKPDLKTAKVFSDETRNKILEILAKGEYTNTQLARLLNLSKAAMTHHLKILEEEGLIRVTRIERERHGIPMKYYTLNREFLPLVISKDLDKFTLLKEKVKEEFSSLLSKKKGKKEAGTVLFRMLKSATLASGINLDSMLYRIGYELGSGVLAEKISATNLDDIMDELKNIWEKLGLGRIEYKKEDNYLKIRVFECYQCSNMPNVGKTLCPSDAGTIAGVLDKKLGRKYKVKEVKCWGTGHNYCEFEVRGLNLVKK